MPINDMDYKKTFILSAFFVIIRKMQDKEESTL